MAPELVTLNDLEGHFPLSGLFKCNPSNIYAAFYHISTDACSCGPSAIAVLLVFLLNTCFFWKAMYTKALHGPKFLTPAGPVASQARPVFSKFSDLARFWPILDETRSGRPAIPLLVLGAYTICIKQHVKTWRTALTTLSTVVMLNPDFLTPPWVLIDGTAVLGGRGAIDQHPWWGQKIWI